MNTAAIAATKLFDIHPSHLLSLFSEVVFVNCMQQIFNIREITIGKNAHTLRYVSNIINVVIRNTADAMYNGRKHSTRNIFSLAETSMYLVSVR